MTIAYSSPSLGEFPVYLADQKGYYRDAGLDVKLTYIRGSAELAAAVLSNNVQVAYTAAEAVLGAAMQGNAQPVILTMADRHYSYNVIAKPEIKTFTELAGKVVSIGSTPGTLPDFALSADLEAHGMALDSVKRVIGGDTATRAAAVISGKADATLLDPPYDLPVVDKGFRSVSSVYEDVKQPVVGTVFYTTRPYAAAHHDQLVGITKALIRAIRFGRANPDETKKLITGWTKIEDQRSLDRGYQVYFNNIFVDDPSPLPQALQQSIDNEAKARKEQSTLKAADFIDASIVKQALQELGG
ncbi:MAG: ABC transporter substrate-binding protein [Chloroflexota bacterium]